MLYLINYPEMQAKIQAELDEVCGDSLPTLAHRSRFILFILRYFIATRIN